MDYEAWAARFVKAMEVLPRNAPQRLVGKLARGEIFLLNFVYKCGGTARPGEMSEALGTSSARIAAAVNSLEKKQYVCRQNDPADKRRTLVHITEGGKRYVEACRRFVTEQVAHVLEKLGERDTKEFLRISQKIAGISQELALEETDFLKMEPMYCAGDQIG